METRDRTPDRHRMVKTELDAARALADLAQLALLETEQARLQLRPQEENRPFVLDLNQHASLLEEHCQQEGSENASGKKMQAREDSLIFKTGLNCPSGSQLPFCGSKTKHCMTEAEKEAKRLRRILANRESARQTIRRRQAFREELTKKADSLSRDNEAMKKEKEVMLGEYLHLKDTNRQLKQKIAERLKVDMDGRAQDPSPSSTTNDTLVTQRLPLIQFAWPPLLAPISILKTNRDFQSANLGNEQGTLCFSPYPWFYPMMHHHQAASPSAMSCTSGNREDSLGKCLDFSKGNVLESGSQSSSYKKDEVCTRAASPTAPLLGLSIEACQKLRPQSWMLNPITESKTDVPSQEKAENSPARRIDAAAGFAAAAAAGARKRRKELTRIRRFHGCGRCE